MKHIADIVIYKADNDFDKILQASGNTGRGLACHPTKEKTEYEPKAEGPCQAIDMNSGEPHGSGFFTTVSHRPGVMFQNFVVAIVASTFVAGRQLSKC